MYSGAGNKIYIFFFPTEQTISSVDGAQCAIRRIISCARTTRREMGARVSILIDFTVAIRDNLYRGSIRAGISFMKGTTRAMCEWKHLFQVR